MKTFARYCLNKFVYVKKRCLPSCHRPLMIGWINGWTNRRINTQFDVGTNGRMNGQLDGWTESWTNGEMGGWTHALIEVLAKSEQHLWKVRKIHANICQAVSTSTLFNQNFYTKLSVHMSISDTFVEGDRGQISNISHSDSVTTQF